MTTAQQDHGNRGAGKAAQAGNQTPEVNLLNDPICCVTLSKLLNLSVPHFFICVMEIVILISTS